MLRLAARACALVLAVQGCSSGSPVTSQGASSAVATTTTSGSTTGSGGAGGTTATSGAGGSGGAAAQRTTLFIGNSYTYVNDLPGILASIASSSGVPPLLPPTSITVAGAALQTHWASPEVSMAIAEGGYDVVVLQGQSVEPLVDPSGFQAHGALLADAAAASGAAVVLYQTWAREEGSDVYAQPWSGGDPAAMQDGLTAAYAALAAQTGATTAPVGEAFRLSMAAHPAIELFAEDGSHPSGEGTYLAACVFYHVLAGAPVPATAALPAGIDDAEAAALQGAAEAALGH